MDGRCDVKRTKDDDSALPTERVRLSRGVGKVQEWGHRSIEIVSQVAYTRCDSSRCVQRETIIRVRIPDTNAIVRKEERA